MATVGGIHAAADMKPTPKEALKACPEAQAFEYRV